MPWRLERPFQARYQRSKDKRSLRTGALIQRQKFLSSLSRAKSSRMIASRLRFPRPWRTNSLRYLRSLQSTRPGNLRFSNSPEKLFGKVLARLCVLNFSRNTKPKLNWRRCASQSSTKRDDYQMQEQRQVAACLRALGSGVSELLKPDITSLLLEGSRDSLLQVAVGIRLLSDHQHNLSLARRAFIKPILSMMEKTIADSAPIDEWLFGSSFTEDLKDAQTGEKAAKDLKKGTAPAPKPVIQPVRQASGKKPARKTSGKQESPCGSNLEADAPGRGSALEQATAEISFPLSFPLSSALDPDQASGLQDSIPGGRQIIREAFRPQQVSETAIVTLMASLAPATLKQYARPLRSWWQFCHRHNFSPFAPLPNQVLDFLATELASAGSYSTLNTARSAVSLISMNSVGDNPLIKRFCKGASVIKPPRPRYNFIWDPSPVIAELGRQFPHEDLNLETVSKKLVLLAALASGQHCQTLALLKVSQISFHAERVFLRVPDRIKTSAPGRYQLLLIFPRFVDHDNLCLFKLLEHYITQTSVLRSEGCDSLFISYKRPHGPDSVQTISKWFRESLHSYGISDSFTAHSTRHASTSQAARRGVAVDNIYRAAIWSGASRVFADFYNRPMVNPDEFANSVLSA
ncbi:uncharacterized protein LOC143899054 [Temnothorax americanus]|uniref:uncharacterized protein LOC143899054 n=1 Tax=Temnothorax americanus TaxID=1964332 RepID=UPI0040677C37